MVPTFMPALSHFHLPILPQTQELGQWVLDRDCTPCSVRSNTAKVMILSLNWLSLYSRKKFLKSYIFSTTDLDLCMEVPVKGQHSYLSFWLYHDGGIATTRPKAEGTAHCTFAITVKSYEDTIFLIITRAKGWTGIVQKNAESEMMMAAYEAW